MAVNPLMGFLALLQGDDDTAASIFSQLGTPAQGNQFLQLAQQQNPVTYPGAGSVTPGMLGLGQATGATPGAGSSATPVTSSSPASGTGGVPNPQHPSVGGGTPLQDTALWGLLSDFFANNEVSPGRGGTEAARDAAARQAEVLQTGEATSAKDETIVQEQAAAQEAATQAATTPAGTPQTAAQAVGQALGGAAMPGMSAEDQFLSSLGALEAPASERPKASVSSVAPGRGTQVNPIAARMLLQMLTPGQAQFPSFANLLR